MECACLTDTLVLITQGTVISWGTHDMCLLLLFGCAEYDITQVGLEPTCGLYLPPFSGPSLLFASGSRVLHPVNKYWLFLACTGAGQGFQYPNRPLLGRDITNRLDVFILYCHTIRCIHTGVVRSIVDSPVSNIQQSPG